MKNDIIKKLTSRKFIVTAITAIAGIITLCIGENEVVDTIAGALMTLIPTVIYCLTEGMIDANNVKTITKVTAEVAEKLGADESTIDIIEQVGAVGEMLTDENTDIEE